MAPTSNNQSDEVGEPTGVAGLPANFDLAAGSPQVFLLRLVGPGPESIAYGMIELGFAYTGTAQDPLEQDRRWPRSSASFLALAGGQFLPGAPVPEAVAPSQARDVYASDAAPSTMPDSGK